MKSKIQIPEILGIGGTTVGAGWYYRRTEPGNLGFGGTTVDKARYHRWNTQKSANNAFRLSGRYYRSGLLKVFSSGLIEDQPHEAIEVDFANEYLGGGALKWGCVQVFLLEPFA
ncbi:hypothetical protein BHE74_00027017 [Ensete ventricosum]|uniref:PARG catalytic Macro domain-containing protein n=1 Tax=Ensete ventricosum TaxID=4639 RepID=A0A445M9K0_ENSVE|nr:hypothetical protein BHE74_00027017 [Ensete ventricosum]RZR70923.1 hypothetical protein BHM03_00002332 [Ensete ventricosum]